MGKTMLPLLALVILIVTPSIASGQCNPDSHNDATSAKAIGLTETVSDWVGANDKWDYYYLDVQQGSSITGTITFDADQTGTTIQLSGPSGVLFQTQGTTDTVRKITIPVQSTSMTAGKYYLRIGFYSSYTYDHHYTITMNLTDSGQPAGGGTTGCVADNNDTFQTAAEVVFGSTVSDYVCAEDTVDVYHFKVTDAEEGSGTVKLTCSPDVLAFLIHDSSESMLYTGEALGGEVTYNLAASGSGLANGDYYITVLLPGETGNDTSYSLELAKGTPMVKITPMLATEIKIPVPVTVATLELGDISLFARIAIDSLYCVSESDWDAGSNSDEPYVIITGVANHKAQKAWSAGKPEIFDDVDSGEIRRIKNQHIVYEDTVPKGSFIGFNVDLLEHDGGSVYDGESWKLIEKSVSSPEGFVVTFAAGEIPWIAGLIGMAVEGLFNGGEDDHVANSVILVTSDDLKNWYGTNPKLFETDLDGGDSGHYKLRWHIEFVKYSSESFNAKFTKHDGFGVGNFFYMDEANVVIAVDEDGPGDFGRFTIYSHNGLVCKKFNAFYTPYDRLAVGDVSGSGYDDIVVASDDNGGFITIYDPNGGQFAMFPAPVTWYDGLAVADMTGDGKAEILLARDDDNMVTTYKANSGIVRKLQLSKWQFEGTRNHDEQSKHDAFLVGDVLGDSKPEIVFIENKNGPSSVIHIYDCNATTDVEVRPSTRFDTMGGTFTHHDGACLGDMTGDGKLDLIIATDQGDGAYGCKIKVYDLTKNVLATERYWPTFTQYDGLACGDLISSGYTQIVVATDEDDKVYITQ